MADSLELELVSPESLLLSQPVEMVVVPGTEGDFGVLPGHAPLIANIRPGALVVFEGGNAAERFFLAGGFAEVTTERCTILAEGAMRVADIDRAAVEQEIRDLREDIAQLAEDADRDAVAASLAIAEAKLQALDAPAYSGVQ
ncbi:MAG: ATP synthase epsilon chain [Alphaproteobacteria bacterium MarineAlpha10_Bin3]|jgi:F-type H+-transporting ATPase subunit epsilon|nr:MAG: ATP synthase epsilon chain [Alphaproteobacteria bacterium MarineAlpha10_Bin3]PPR69802.1 MAG: ATP synthase epsilon chain [Alphaproteobacteria bacterium MarineAlpha4_Bin1]